MEKKISYLNKTFNDYKASLMGFTRQYYPEISNDLNDASVGSWIIDVAANIADGMSYHIDRALQETNIDSANEMSSICALARNNGVKIPGPKGALAEVEFSCVLPADGGNTGSSDLKPNFNYAPIIYKGTKITSSNQIFEVMYDIDFAEQFNQDGISNRKIVPIKNNNGFVQSYKITKTAVICNGESKVYTKTIDNEDITPFMSFVIPDENIMEIESIIVKEGKNYRAVPKMQEFMVENEEFNTTDGCGNEQTAYRFFEVDSLAQQFRWGNVTDGGRSTVVSNLKFDNPSLSKLYNVTTVSSNTNKLANYFITKGEWKPLRHKFISEFTNNGYLKVTFGAGMQEGIDGVDLGENRYEKYYMQKVLNNDALGVLPKPDTTMYVLYRKGGGKTSNVPKGAINSIQHLSAFFRGENKKYIGKIRSSIEVSNTSPSVSGKDMMSETELKYFIKYHNASQERCVTLKDYYDRVMLMPPKYGTPYKMGVTEENNKVMIYLLGSDNNGKLSSVLPDILVKNIENYLSEYRSINDYVEMKSGRIINVSFEIDFYYDKNYNPSEVSKNIIETVKKYMDVQNHQMGDDIFVGDIEKEISKLDGVTNLIDLRVYNEYGEGYSKDRTTQKIIPQTECYGEEYVQDGVVENRDRIDLKYSDKTLFTENDTMMEVKYDSDIKLRPKIRG